MMTNNSADYHPWQVTNLRTAPTSGVISLKQIRKRFLYNVTALMSLSRTKTMKIASFSKLALALFVSLIVAVTVHAWDYEGHRVVNQLGLAALPKDFPAFVKTPEARERIAFLAGEPDRWRNQGDGRNPTDDVVLSHFAGPDHYFDMEDLDPLKLKPTDLPIFRFEFAGELAKLRAAHPDRFEPIDPARNTDRTKALPGFAPWAITELTGKLRSGFSYLKAFQDYGGTPEEIANAQANIIYVMGVLGHYVGDCAQPLHLTKHHHGWVGPNPQEFTTNSGIHSRIDGGFFRRTGGVKADPLLEKIRPAKIVNDPLKSDDLFRKVMAYLQESHQFVEPLYRLDKEGKLTPENPDTKEGRDFLEAQLVRGGQMLGDLWYSAWQQAGEDTFLIRALKARQAAPK